MKINFIVPFTSLTGGIKIIFEYCNRLSARGHDVLIYVPMKAYKFNNKGLVGKLVTLKSSVGNTLKRGTKVDWFDLDAKVKLVPIIKNAFIRDADICVATAWPTAYDVYNLDDSKGKKVYLIQHYEIWSGEKDLVDGSYKLPMNQIVIAKWLQETMKDKFNQNSTLIYNGINFDEFKYKDEFKDNKDIIISMLYHSLEWKGFKDGLSAFEIVKKKYPGIKLKLFGTESGEDIPEYAEFYEMPTKSELNNIYNESDIFIFPSKSEGWGLTVVEAMACKCAVVGTNTGALSEIGIHEKNAMISNPNDVNALAENIIKLIDNEEIRKNISEEGYITALNLDWSISVDKIENLFKELKNKE